MCKLAELKTNFCSIENYWIFFASFFVLFGIVCLPLSSFAVNNFFSLACFFMLLSKRWREKWPIINQNNYVVLFGLLFLLVLIFGTFYSRSIPSLTLQGFFKYTKILFILCLMPFFVAFPKLKKQAENALILGVFISLIVSLLNVFGIPVFGKISIHPGGYFIHPIYTSVLLSFALFILLNRFCDEKNNLWCKWLYLVLFVAGFYTLFFVYIERTGYLIALGLFVLFLVQRLKLKGFLLALVLTPLLVGSLYKASPIFQQRSYEAIDNIINYFKTGALSSVGSRISFGEHSFLVIKEHPVFGVGTGSFNTVYRETGGPEKNLGHPHNEYIFILFQVGAIGLAVLLIWLTVQLVVARKLPLQDRRLMQGLILAFIINGFCNVVLSINATGMLYIVFLSVYFSSLYIPLEFNNRSNLREATNS
jgi:O-antigen ligase